MEPKDHTTKSFERLYRDNPQFFLDNWLVLRVMILELHSWLDAFNCTKTSQGDFTGIHCMEHRQVRHHPQGVNEAVVRFTAEYGQEFGQIIEQEAKAHIYEDFGFMPSQDDYCKRFWREIRGF